jgi:hypothetical protein
VKYMPRRVEIKGFTRPAGGGFFVNGYVMFPEQKTGAPVSFLVDSGASITVLSHHDALALGLDYDKLTKEEGVALTFGGPLVLYEAQNTVLFLATEDGSLHRIPLAKIRVLPPQEQEYGIPSVLGMDALTNFVIDFVPSHGRLYLRARDRAVPKPAKKKRRCFLSHNSKDKAFVRRLAGDLQRNGVDVWFDEWKIKPGDSIAESIEDGLKTFNNFVLVMTPNSMASRWVARELSVTLYKYNSSPKRGRKRVRIIPALVEECGIPMWLRDIKYVDFRRDYRSALRELLSVLV